MIASADGPETVLEAVDVSRETLARLERHGELLRKWSARINLVAPSTMSQMWRRHFVDSAQIFPLRPPGARTWLDLGSGAGFPGLVVAAIAAEKAPDLRVTLVESDARKCAFLATVARDTGLAVEIINDRIEDVPPRPVDVVSARALAPLSRLLDRAAPFAGAGAACLFLKGENAARELTEARGRWHMDVTEHRSRTERRSVVLDIREFRRVSTPSD